jgi:hypothetical protein
MYARQLTVPPHLYLARGPLVRLARRRGPTRARWPRRSSGRSRARRPAGGSRRGEPPARPSSGSRARRSSSGPADRVVVDVDLAPDAAADRDALLVLDTVAAELDPAAGRGRGDRCGHGCSLGSTVDVAEPGRRRAGGPEPERERGRVSEARGSGALQGRGAAAMVGATDAVGAKELTRTLIPGGRCRRGSSRNFLRTSRPSAEPG